MEDVGVYFASCHEEGNAAVVVAVGGEAFAFVQGRNICQVPGFGRRFCLPAFSAYEVEEVNHGVAAVFNEGGRDVIGARRCVF